MERLSDAPADAREMESAPAPGMHRRQAIRVMTAGLVAAVLRATHAEAAPVPKPKALLMEWRERAARHPFVPSLEDEERLGAFISERPPLPDLLRAELRRSDIAQSHSKADIGLDAYYAHRLRAQLERDYGKPPYLDRHPCYRSDPQNLLGENPHLQSFIIESKLRTPADPRKRPYADIYWAYRLATVRFYAKQTRVCEDAIHEAKRVRDADAIERATHRYEASQAQWRAEWDLMKDQ